MHLKRLEKKKKKKMEEEEKEEKKVIVANFESLGWYYLGALSHSTAPKINPYIVSLKYKFTRFTFRSRNKSIEHLEARVWIEIYQVY